MNIEIFKSKSENNKNMYQKINLFLIYLVVCLLVTILHSKFDKNLPIVKIMGLKSEPQIENDINKLIFGSSDEQNR